LSRFRNRSKRSADIWPGFVDAISTLLLVLIFLLALFLASEFFLSKMLSKKEDALEGLNLQIFQLSELLSLEKKENNIEKSFFSIFITTFTTIFIAELGDKTQIATLMLSAESGKPIIVFLGSSLALISSSIVGVLIGKWVSKKISPSKFALSTGTLMILISIFLAYETFKNYL